MANSPKTLFHKIWDSHVVRQEPSAPAILYIDLHLIHEVTSPQAFQGLREKGLRVRRPERTIGTMDHSTPTLDLDLSLVDDMAAKQVRQMQANCEEFGIQYYGMVSPQRGVVHVIGPELGLTQPGMTIVCGDSHTSTHGAFGSLAYGIGTSEVEHVLATQCMLQYQPNTYQISFDGSLGEGVTAKDMILALISRIGVGGGTGSVIEYSGSAVYSLAMDERMTLCNMSIEAGARAGMIAPDDTTYEYIVGRPHAPQGEKWEQALNHWRTLPSDPGAEFDLSLTIDADQIEPMITYGTNPGMGIPINGTIPDPITVKDISERQTLEKSLAYMDLKPGDKMEGQPIDVVFIGSCSNARITDLRQAASILKDRKVADGLRLLVVPGSESTRRQAESEGIDEIVRQAGGEWRFAGCSMCIAMNGDQLSPGQYAVSTSNRNFEGRQGPGGRTFLASPLTAAASAVTGYVTDPRKL